MNCVKVALSCEQTTNQRENLQMTITVVDEQLHYILYTVFTQSYSFLKPTFYFKSCGIDLQGCLIASVRNFYSQVFQMFFRTDASIFETKK